MDRTERKHDMMSQINSVLGPIDTKNLGFTLMHETRHEPGFRRAGLSRAFRGERFLDRIIDGVPPPKQGGIDTIIDATTFDLGRDVSLLADISRRTGVNIIAAPGGG
jgi:phosphotriesterase-related protein